MKALLFLLVICVSAFADDSNEFQGDYGFEMRAGHSANGESNPFLSAFHLHTPNKRVKINATLSAGGLLPMAAAVMIPQKGLFDGTNDIFGTVNGLKQGHRNTVGGVSSGAGLLTTSIGLSVSIRKDRTKPVDPVTAVEQSDLFPLLQKEFGAQKARDLVFARMVEGWNFKMMAKKYFPESIRPRAIKLANEEYEKLAPYKAQFGTNLREQEAVIDAKVGQIVLLSLALEQATDNDTKTAIAQSIEFLRNEHLKKDDSTNPVNQETPASPKTH